MEKVFAPRVVIPPWASSKAWNIKTIIPNTVIAVGPKSIVHRPTPVGCELLPVTEGIFKADKTKANAPAIPSNIFKLGWRATVLLMERTPAITKGIIASHQNAAQL